ncbi:MAG: prepilin-type N-terminal cleavage/methylation domain-containing protein [Planctomycetota bacterium]|jgi:prepilin-type N-terminal cleavage/methylation domain-containing protein
MRPCKLPHRTAGFSLIEVLIAITVFAVSIGAVGTTLVATTALSKTSNEISEAVESACSLLEQVRAEEFQDIFATYNDSGADDIDGVDTAPGSSFDVDGKSPWVGSVSVGEVIFPGDGIELREDFVDRELGMPRDLNGDGVIDDLNHASDYTILPLRVRVRWSGKSGEIEKSMVSVLIDF